METVQIGCKLPHGLVLEVGTPTVLKSGELSSTYKAVELNGLSKARKGAKYGVTTVPAEVWASWATKNRNLRYVVDGSVFVVT